MSETTTSLFCPICGQKFLRIPVKDGVVLEQIFCYGCSNNYLIVITENGKFVITAELCE